MDAAQTDLQHALGVEWMVWPSADGCETYIANVAQRELALSVGKYETEIIATLSHDHLAESSAVDIAHSVNCVWAKYGPSLLAKYRS